MTDKEIEKLAKKNLRKERFNYALTAIVTVIMFLGFISIALFILVGPHLLVVNLADSFVWSIITGIWAVLPLMLGIVFGIIDSIKDYIENREIMLNREIHRLEYEEAITKTKENNEKEGDV